MRTDPIIRQKVEDIVGRDGLLSDGDDMSAFTVDWTAAHRGYAPFVVFPRTADEVAGLIVLAREHGLALVPQGGNTGLVAAGVPMDGEIVLSTRRLRQAPDVDSVSATALVGAGVPVQTLQEEAARRGLLYGVDLASRGSATIGGNVGTNAGGLRVMRYGDTRAQVIGMEAVFGTGEVLRRLGGLLRDNTGYHLSSLLVGSEGTLAVVTAVQVRLRPPTTGRAVSLVGFDTPACAVDAAMRLRRGNTDLSAVELMLKPGLTLVAGQRAWGFPLPEIPSAALLVEFTGDRALDDLTDAVGDLKGVTAAVLDDGVRAREGLWRWRESHTECIGQVGAPVKMDITLPTAALKDFLEEVPGLVRRVVPHAETWLFGHVADGNVHVNVTGCGGTGETAERVAEAVLFEVARLDGSISTEHGIGRTKRRWLQLTRSEAEITAARAVKAALDPDGVLNPNVLFPVAAEPARSARSSRSAPSSSGS